MHTDALSYWQITVRARTAALDNQARTVLTDVHQLGLSQVKGVRTCRFFFLHGKLQESSVRHLAEKLLVDPVAETYTIAPGLTVRDWKQPSIEVHLQPGVMNPPALTILKAAQQLLGASELDDTELVEVQTARGYEFSGEVSAGDLEQIASRVLANSCIERWYIQSSTRHEKLPESFPTPPRREFVLRHVPLKGMDDSVLSRLSRDGHLFLSLDEMRAIRDYYVRQVRDPTDLELETLAQTWSEHCVHKTLKSEVRYRGLGFGSEIGEIDVTFGNLLRDTIAAVTRTLNKSWCLSVFVDNAGVIEFDDEFGIAFKVETHNHPSAIEPYGGASTGVGGCIRDIMGCGLGAKPIASTDVFCLAHPDFDEARLPKDVLHPRRTLKGVVGGVRDYGNRMGIPTVNGAIYFDDRYLANPLVYCGCVGLIPRNRLAKAAQPGDLIVVAGGRTGRDGIHGATFSSAELTDTHADEFAHAVQIGNAIEQKKVLDAMLLARDHAKGRLYSAVTDCGAGGLSSAVGEMGADIGASVNLETVPLKYAGLRYDEIWISEAQERMVFAVPPQHWPDFQRVFHEEEVEATAIGTFTNDHTLTVRYQGSVVGKLDMHFLHEGRPANTREAIWSKQPNENPVNNTILKKVETWNPLSIENTSKINTAAKLIGNDRLIHELRQLNVASKEWVIRQYDHEVQGRSVVKPLMGANSGPSDAAVLRPRYDSNKGIAIGCGLCPELFDFDPYWMAVAAIDEAFRNIICVGANPDRVAILDNFCWPKCDTPEGMGSLVRACRGAHDAAIAYGLPFISGKDSLNNQFSMSDEESRRTGLPRQLAIPGTLLISAIGIVDDVQLCKTLDFKHPGHRLVLASAGESFRTFDESLAIHRKVSSLIRERKVVAAHDVSDGGLIVTIAEMCIASGLGAELTLPPELANEALFANRMTSYVLEMSQENATQCGFPIIGTVTENARLKIAACGVDASIEELSRVWREPLANGGGRVDG